MHQLAMALEEVLSLEIPAEGLLKLRTVGELVDYVSIQPVLHCAA
jgi:acyl carrier protein